MRTKPASKPTSQPGRSLLAGLAQCTLFPSSMLPQLRTDSSWAKLSQIGYNWDRCSASTRLWHARQYYTLLQRLPSASCPASRPQPPWSQTLPTACPDHAGASSTPGAEFTAVCRTWMYIQTSSRYRVTLEVDAPGADYAAWAALITRGRTGRFEGAAYLSTRSAVGPDGVDVVSQGGNQWDGATVRLGTAAARVSEQARWYYVSSVVTGRTAADAAAAARLRRWRVGVQALAHAPGRGAVGCEAHGVDFMEGALRVITIVRVFYRRALGGIAACGHGWSVWQM